MQPLVAHRRMLRHSAKLAATVALACLANGCGVVDAIFEPPEGFQSSLPRNTAAKRSGTEPLVANRFAIAPGDDVVGELQVVYATADDTFVEIARTYDVGFDELKSANPSVDPWLPGAGTAVVLPTRFVLPSAPREGIVLNIAAKRLFYYPPAAGDETAYVETYPIGIGRTGWETPTGETEVVSKARDPVWFVPASIRKEHAEAGDPLPPQVPPGPDNPLGNRVLGLGIPGYLIHGTNKPGGVGMRVSHGCVRLYPEDIEMLFEDVPVGTPVRIVNQPYLLGWQGDDLVLEAHPPLEEDERDWLGGLDTRARARLVDSPNPRARLRAGQLTNIAEAQLGVPLSVLAGGAPARAAIGQARRVDNVIVHEVLVDAADADDGPAEL